MDGALSAADVGTSSAHVVDDATVGVENSFTTFTPPRPVDRSVGRAPRKRVPRQAEAATRTEVARRNTGWTHWYIRRLVIGDFTAAAIAAACAFFIRIPYGLTADHYNEHYAYASLLLPLFWLAVMALSNVYDTRILGIGPEELQRSIRGFIGSIAAIGFVSYALRAHVARGYVVMALPLALVLSALMRHLVRKSLHHARGAGRFRTAVVAVGDADSVADLAQRMHAELYIGMRVVGACIPRLQLSDPAAIETLARANVVPLGDLDSVVMAVNRARADTVAVTASRDIGPRRLRELSWELEDTSADLVVSPGLVEVAGPRMHIRPVTGLPLLQIEKPEFSGGRRLLKGFVDRAAALLGLLLLSPLLIGLFFAIRLRDNGPAFFRQTRVGKNGNEFRIWKFRSMYVDAEARLPDIRDLNENADGLLFKVRGDPRVTPIGRFIRRYSLDELPQLFNVLNGTMSLVGPRPPLPSEVAQYGFDVRRRLLVRPGLTGLWQVSGRSDLSWEESVRLDLRYVENWSLGQDALILWKTASAVLHGSGAY
jgi:exopolysaccharide biosynthesis polyprenyl glycosylphosphotransferase